METWPSLSRMTVVDKKIAISFSLDEFRNAENSLTIFVRRSHFDFSSFLLLKSH